MTRRLPELRPALRAAAVLASAALLSACAGRSPAAAPVPDRPMTGLDATVWIQGSAGYEAAALQTYRLARRELDRALADSSRSAVLDPGEGYRSRPPAVILDVDETVLDNSPYQARLVRSGRDFSPETWAAWVREEAAEPVPGALAFTRAAAERGVEVFYVTNRDHRLEPATRANLRRRGFPLPEGGGDRLLMQDERPAWGSDKGSRRAHVAEDHRVLLLLGDDLNDFVSGARESAEAYHRIRERHRDRFGRSWFMLPNPTYGTWERAARGFRSGLSTAEAIRLKLESLDTGR